MNVKTATTALVTAAAAVSLAGCATVSTNALLVPIQTATAQATLGLASSDEVTISNVKRTPGALPGAETATYTATTATGRTYQCTAIVNTGMIGEAPIVDTPVCQ